MWTLKSSKTLNPVLSPCEAEPLIQTLLSEGIQHQMLLDFTEIFTQMLSRSTEASSRRELGAGLLTSAVMLYNSARLREKGCHALDIWTHRHTLGVHQMTH